MDGNEYKLSEQKGKKVYVKYWASWSPICLDVLNELDDMAEKGKDYQIVTVVSPGISGEKSKDDFKKWFESLGYKNIKVLFDESGDFAKNYGVSAVPTNAFID